MPRTDTNPPQEAGATKRDGIVELLRAFQHLADRYADRPMYGGFQERNRPEYAWRQVGTALENILKHPSHPEQAKAAHEVQRLVVEEGCSSLDIAGFLFDCSRGIGASVSELLQSAGFDQGRIKAIHDRCESLATEIEKFNSSLPGPITYIDVGWKGITGTWEARQMFTCIPVFLRYYATVINKWPPTIADKAFMDDYRRFGRNWLLCYLYLYLKQVRGSSYSTLSVLLAVMRDAWFEAFPEGQKALENKSFETAVSQFPFLIYAVRKRGKNKLIEIDPLGVRALQAAVSEFSRNNLNSIPHIKQHMKRYFDEAQYAKLREEGATFLELLDSF